MDDLTGAVLDGKYRLVRSLGQGGMGGVYEAVHTVITRKVAVKVLHHRSTQQDRSLNVRRFLQEARAASAVGHPGIIEIHDVGHTEDGLHYMVMELLPGESLGDLLRRSGALTVERSVEITLGILDALDAAHGAGIIHRDLKPDNVFLVSDGSGVPQVKLLDFGISKLVGEDNVTLDGGLTATGTVVGTPLYMSPEQARGGQDIDRTTDIWAVGVILYQMLAGTPPFQGDTYNELISKILMDQPPRLREMGFDGPADLDTIVGTATEKDRGARFQSARFFAEALRALDLGAPSPVSLDTTGPTLTAEEAGPQATQHIRSRSWWMKALLWYALTIPAAAFALIMLAAAPDMVSRGLFSIFGLPSESPFELAVTIATLLSIGLAGASVLTHRFWARGRRTAILHGPWFVVIPGLFLLASYRHHEAYAAMLDTILASMKTYGPVTETTHGELMYMLGVAFSRYINTASITLILLSILTYFIVLGYAFRSRKRVNESRSWSRTGWILMGAGLAVWAICFLVVFPRLYVEATLWATLPLLPWALTTFSVFERGPGSPQSDIQQILTGLVAVLALIVLGCSAGFTHLWSSMAEISLRHRILAYELGVGLVTRYLVVTLALMSALLFMITVGAFRLRSPGTSWRPVLRYPGAHALVASAILVALVFPLLRAGTVRTGEIGSIPSYKPGLFEMVPGALEEGEAPSFFIDRSPAVLGEHAPEFHTRLTGEPSELYSVEALLEQLSGAVDCRPLLLNSVNMDEDGRYAPAVCLNAVEARLFCEVRGKRLPSPDEWEATVGGGQDVELPAAGGEWVMTIDLGTPVFGVMGLAPGHPETDLNPRTHSPKVGFRCAFRFEDDGV